MNNNSMSELTNNLNYVKSNNVKSNNVKSNNVPNNVSNVTNNGGQFAMMDIEEKFINDYNELFKSEGEVNGFKHAFYEFYQIFIDVEKLKEVCKHLKNKRGIVNDFFLKNEHSLINIYVINRYKLTKTQHVEVSDYILGQRKYALNAINKFEFNTIPRGGKRKQTKRNKKKRKQTKRKQTKRKQTK